MTQSEPPPDEAPAKARNKKAEAIVGISGLSFIAVIGLAVAFSTPSSGDDRSPALDRTAAETACEDYVSDRLKAPSTAEFSSTEVTPNADGMTDRFRVVGSVDSQNSYGAMLRSTYTCTIDLADGQWSLVDLDVVE